MFMSKNDDKHVHPSIKRLEDFLLERGISRVRFLEENKLYSQQYNNWRTRGLPRSIIPDISKWSGLNYDYLKTGQMPKFNSASGTLFQIEQRVNKTDDIEIHLKESPSSYNSESQTLDLSADALPENYKLMIIKIYRICVTVGLSEPDVKIIEAVTDRYSSPNTSNL